MLVVTRREQEEIVIGPPANPIAVVRLVAITGDRVRIGVTAARSIDVHRREVADEIIQQQATPPVPSVADLIAGRAKS